MTTTRHRGTWTPEDQASSVYQYLPFDVPPGTDAISARLGYDRRHGILDLGLFGPDGFRGWSGGERTEFTVTTGAATPGYLPGPLPPGEWHVILGLYGIPAAGTVFELEITTGVSAAATTDVSGAMAAGLSPPQPGPLPERPPTRNLPAAAGRRWLRGDLHSHTVHSDGQLWVDELACLARAQGLDFLAVTDHNTVSHHPELEPASRRTGVVLLPGQEVTTDDGHANVLGSPVWLDFRRPVTDWFGDAAAAGALLSINHPVRNDCAWRHPLPHPADLVEAWHSSWDRRGTGGLPPDWWRRFGRVAVGGSDFHRPSDPMRPGTPTTWVEIEPVTSAGGPADALGSVREVILDALRAGRVTLSASPTAPVLIRHEDSLVVVDGEGTTLHAPDGSTQEIGESRIRVPDQPGAWWVNAPEGRVVAAVL